MQRVAIKKEVFAILNEVLPEIVVTEEVLLLGPKGILDSLTAVHLVNRIADFFKIDLLAEDLTLDSLTSVETLVEFLAKKIEE